MATVTKESRDFGGISVPVMLGIIAGICYWIYTGIDSEGGCDTARRAASLLRETGSLGRARIAFHTRWTIRLPK
jgi:hypothetical protein